MLSWVFVYGLGPDYAWDVQFEFGKAMAGGYGHVHLSNQFGINPLNYVGYRILSM
jgi:hypothetical protein